MKSKQPKLAGEILPVLRSVSMMLPNCRNGRLSMDADTAGEVSD
jgi:hypothetical protein